MAQKYLSSKYIFNDRSMSGLFQLSLYGQKFNVSQEINISQCLK